MTLFDFFTCIETQYKNTLPFVVYRKPGESSISALLQEDDCLHITKEFTEKGFVFAPFDDAQDAVLLPSEQASRIVCSDYEVIPVQLHGKPLSVVNNEQKAFHINLVNKGVKAIQASEFQKVVLSRQEEVEVKGSNPIEIFKNLLNHYSLAFVYCLYHPKVGLWLGATPETLIKIEGPQFSIMSLAGTQEYNGTLDVTWQEKEKEEQQFVTDFIIDSIKPSVDYLRVSETETVKAGNLVHLRTLISARLVANSSLKEVISIIHPTPAVCGLPKQASKDFILEHENYNREFYTGFLGELNMETVAKPRSGARNIENRAYAMPKKSTQLYVNLRCMQIKNHTAIIYVGGGITAHSHSESEWEETVSKSKVMKNVL
ncbi:chorismate-binding protein [Aestuariibaculum suncheonense]|uniref:Chorismate-binding protein n=1 Tax=Aestuariibaculum suncheonense TaxID=1028745 RepID=A0A8J6QDL3_9FLAO|nr:chorismate-binding protein [Aestuariibaculum suncheonense]MBD0835130.1 chorismate-binding protein [Aestuariibaculum suncheonense]